MKYEFHVGDYVETKDGRVGYITKICHCEVCKDRGFYEPYVRYNDGEEEYITEILCSTFQFHLIRLEPKVIIMQYPLYDSYCLYSNDFIHIGQYDFKKDKVEPLSINKHISIYCGNGKTNSPSDYKTAFEQDELNDKMIDKINGLVDAVNELRDKND